MIYQVELSDEVSAALEGETLYYDVLTYAIAVRRDGTLVVSDEVEQIVLVLTSRAYLAVRRVETPPSITAADLRPVALVHNFNSHSHAVCGDPRL